MANYSDAIEDMRKYIATPLTLQNPTPLQTKRPIYLMAKTSNKIKLNSLRLWLKKFDVISWGENLTFLCMYDVK